MASDAPSRIAATCAVAGSLLLLVGTILHPQGADPNDPVAAFTEYAADRGWVASHLTQLAGVALMVAALLCLTEQLERGAGRICARIAHAGAIAGLAVATALQAVDGIALKNAVDAWAAAPPATRGGAFFAAFAVRQIEIGLAAMLSLALGTTVVRYGAALWLDLGFPAWLGPIAIAGGGATAIAGVVIAYTGFSGLAMAINMPAGLLLLAWMVLLGVRLWQRGGARAPARPSPEGR